MPPEVFEEHQLDQAKVTFVVPEIIPPNLVREYVPQCVGEEEQRVLTL